MSALWILLSVSWTRFVLAVQQCVTFHARRYVMHPTKTTLSSSFNFPTRESTTLSLSADEAADSGYGDELGYIRGTGGHSGARVHQAWLPLGRGRGRAGPGLFHEQKIRQGSGWWASGEGYTNASWQRGLFPSSARTPQTQTHAITLLLFTSTNIQDSSWHRRRGSK